MNGFDEQCAADLALVVEGRRLHAGDADRLTRAVVGAIRPNRDKPFWDLAHALVALHHLHADRTAPAKAVVDLVLDPGAARPETLRQKLSEERARPGAAARLTPDGMEMQLPERSWAISFSRLARILGLAEFLLTCNSLENFGIVNSLIEGLNSNPDPEDLTRTLVRLITAYRLNHVPLARFEKRFRAILTYLHRDGVHRPVTDEAIFGFWRAEIDEGERTHFRTVVEHFATYVKLATVLRGLANVRGAGSLDAIDGWQDRLDAMLSEVAGEEETTALLAEKLRCIPEHPKILTGAERDDMIGVLGLDPFHRTHPRTVLRATSFGFVQSGIANRLRRGAGGGSVRERVTCADASTYGDVIARLGAIHEHLRRMLKIALALRFTGEDAAGGAVANLVAAAEADIRRVRRAGFDLPRDTLAAAFATLDEMLAKSTEEIAVFLAAGQKLGGENVLAALHAEDTTMFAEGLTAAYAERVSDGLSR